MRTYSSKIALLASAISLVIGGNALADNTENQLITYEVQAINEITVSGNPGALVISTATAGSQPDDATETTTSYSITTNGSNKKLVGKLDTAMPANVVLELTATAPSVGSSVGEVTLTATDADLVTGITQVIGSNLSLAYRLSATVAAGVVASASKTVTLTLVDGA